MKKKAPRSALRVCKFLLCLLVLNSFQVLALPDGRARGGSPIALSGGSQGVPREWGLQEASSSILCFSYSQWVSSRWLSYDFICFYLAARQFCCATISQRPAQSIFSNIPRVWCILQRNHSNIFVKSASRQSLKQSVQQGCRQLGSPTDQTTGVSTSVRVSLRGHLSYI